MELYSNNLKLRDVSCLDFRLFIAYVCPFAQRVWITRNCKVCWGVLLDPGDSA